MGKTLVWVGGVLTGVYLLVIALCALCWWGKFTEMKPNEWGDFLAGAFGPLAVAWLILGFLQQGIELRQNSEALLQQAEELANTVEQQREMVKVAREQLLADRDAFNHQLKQAAAEAERVATLAKPKFSIGYSGIHSDTSKHKFAFFNYGPPCTDVKLILETGNSGFNPPLFPVIKTNDTADFVLELSRHVEPAQSFVLLLFTDSHGIPGSYRYQTVIRQTGDHWSIKLAHAPTATAA